MSVVLLDTGFNIEVAFRLAPFHKRLLAWVVDFAILLSYFYIVNLIFGEAFSLYRFRLWGWMEALLTLPYLLYHLLCEALLNGQSVGKKLLKIRVITAEGGAPTMSQYVLRWMFRLIDMMPWGIPALLSIVLTPSSQRLGDLVAGTLVIDTRNDLSWQDTLFETVEEHHVPKYPAVMQLSDKDINTLKNIVQAGRKKPNFTLNASVAERVCQKLGIKTEEAPEDFLQTLLKDYNFYTNN